MILGCNDDPTSTNNEYENISSSSSMKNYLSSSISIVTENSSSSVNEIVLSSSSKKDILSSSSIANATISSSSSKMESSSSVIQLNTQTCVYIEVSESLQCEEQVYKTKKIGSQVWMAENLNFYVDNFSSLCYDDQISGCDNGYGRLYDWETANQVCPLGWHLPSYDEWNVLFEYVGGKLVAGTKLKALKSWDEDSPIAGTDEYGFGALAGGMKEYSIYSGDRKAGYWWTSTNPTKNYAWIIKIDYYDEYINYSKYGMNYGMSVRCIKD